MTKEFSSELQTALARDAIVSVILLKIETSSGAKYYTNAAFDIVTPIVDGVSRTYEAQGYFLGITEMDENSDLAISSINISLSALDSTITTTFAVPGQINKTVTIYRVFFDQSTGSLVGDSVGDTGFMIFQGRVSGYQITDAEETATLTLTVDSQFSNFEKINCRRTNLDSWQRSYDGLSTSNDYSMQFSHETINDLNWGKK